MQSAGDCCAALAQLTETDATAVLPFSTGVIGEPLPAGQISAALPAALDDLRDTGWERAASAILTTDTRAKLRSTEVELDGQRCTITGIAKGGGHHSEADHHKSRHKSRRRHDHIQGRPLYTANHIHVHSRTH